MICTAYLEKPMRVFLNTRSVCLFPIRRFVDNIEILDEQVVYRNGPFMRVKRWLRGVHPHLGMITHGLTGLETLVEKDVIRPINTFYVNENKNDADQTVLRRTDSQYPEPSDTQKNSEPHGVDGDAIQLDQRSSSPIIQTG